MTLLPQFVFLVLVIIACTVVGYSNAAFIVGPQAPISSTKPFPFLTTLPPRFSPRRSCLRPQITPRRLEMSVEGDDDTIHGFPLPSLFVPLVGLALLLGSVLVHLDGWSHFVSSLAEMKANATGEEFWSAISFWLFAAISHPLLKPIFGISEVLHASPGPKLAGLIPITFLVGSGAVAYALTISDTLRKIVGVTLLAGLLHFVGAGLDGKTPSLLGDYNIQLDDDYKGKIVKGCPPPQSVRLPSVNEKFDYQKYQGRWYWHEVHDWTQFREMYDTTLDIRTTDNGYVNTLTIKGPSPSTSPLAWDKSPLMNGVRYSWVGTVDKSEQTLAGVSQESGFGVSFPNYIVDVQTTKNEASSEDEDYQELIQFQCIEVGGVRIYEGIDFMSRSPTMTEEELGDMHRRAQQAGLDPYGAAPEQMHQILQRTTVGTSTSSSTENEWQRLWKRLNVEQYLDQSL